MTATLDDTDMFRPPVNRAMKILDRSYFKKTIPISIAKVLDQKQILNCRNDLHHDILKLERTQAVKTIQDSQGNGIKALLLRPEIKSEDQSTWSPRLSELVRSSQVAVTPYDLTIDYDYWTYYDIISSILPEDLGGEPPSGFSVIGHVAHLNLREPYFPYKNLIAQILLDKNPNIRTIINKIDEVGEKNQYRTFSYELLAGDPDMNVVVHEANCTFRFDYSKVYWNSRLETEHRRIVERFLPGEAICDVMAGVGPFAIPAGKKKCFVWANDLNPESYASLMDAVKRNKVSDFVKPFNQDGHEFIRAATKKLLHSDTFGAITSKHSQAKSKKLVQGSTFGTMTSKQKQTLSKTLSPVYLPSPKTFSHYVLNLPASAIDFLPAFVGVYAGSSDLFEPSTTMKLPMIHVHCFSTKSDDNKEENWKICEEISERLNFDIKPGTPEVEGQAEIWDVRDVAPSKRMYCASFRLPRDVAFREALDQTSGPVD